MNNFWEKLPKPFFVLAPMEDVTDTVFRQIVAKYGRPDLFFTEFTNADGICHFATMKNYNKGSFHFGRDDIQNPIFQRLVFDTTEKPIVAQIWGKEPEKYFEAARIVAEMGFDGIDINMACPVRPVLKIGCGGALIGRNSEVGEIVAAVQEGSGGLPVSVKTRLGTKNIMTEEWIGFLLTLKLQAITIHGRTVAQKSEGLANWEEIGKCVKLRDFELSNRSRSVSVKNQGKSGNSLAEVEKQENLRDFSTRPDGLGRNDIPVSTLIVGNGDIKSLKQAREMVERYQVDGVMIGRGIFENVAVFDKDGRILSPVEKLSALKYHAKLFMQTWGEGKDFQIIKKFVKAYVNGFEGAAGIREQLMKSQSEEELQELITRVIVDLPGKLTDHTTDKR